MSDGVNVVYYNNSVRGMNEWRTKDWEVDHEFSTKEDAISHAAKLKRQGKKATVLDLEHMFYYVMTK